MNPFGAGIVGAHAQDTLKANDEAENEGMHPEGANQRAWRAGFLSLTG
jgi:hypothetical protein